MLSGRVGSRLGKQKAMKLDQKQSREDISANRFQLIVQSSYSNEVSENRRFI